MRAALLLTFLLLLPVPALAFTAVASFDVTYAPKDTTPFAAGVCWSGLAPNSSYELKVSVGNSGGSSPASQTWTGNAWQQSSKYAFNITANSSGAWCGIVYLQMATSNKGWTNYIMNASTAYLGSRIRDSSSSTSNWAETTVNLLDICDPILDDECDHSGLLPAGQTNGAPGGYITGSWPGAGTIKLRNSSGALVGFWTPEDNGITEGYRNTSGYFKLAAPAGNLTLEAGGVARNISLVGNGTTYAGYARDLVLYETADCDIDGDDFCLSDGEENYFARPGRAYTLFGLDSLEYENTEYIKLFGEANLAILNVTPSAAFGSFGLTTAKLTAGNSNELVRAVAYIYSPNWATQDIDGSTLRTNLSESRMAIEFAINRGGTYLLQMPLLVKSACDGYSPGTYTGKVRLFKQSGGEWEDWLDRSFNISLTGGCSPSSSGGNTGTVSVMVLPKSKVIAEEQPVLIEIINLPELRAGSSVSYKVRLHSRLNESRNIDIYSYVFSGHALASAHGWTANRQSIELPAGKSVEITLTNELKPEAIGNWTLRVRATDGEDVWTANWPVVIKASASSAGGQTEGTATARPEGPTGRFLQTGWLMEAIIKFFADLWNMLSTKLGFG